MKNASPTSFGATSVLLTACLLLAPAVAQAQLPRDPAERARVIAEIFKANSRQITVFDREGKVVSSVGSRDLYNQPILSPDATRVAVVKPDLEKETNDVWILDVATGKGQQLTSSQSRESANSPVWSPDGSQIAFVALRGGYYGVYRKASNGEGAEELLYRNSAPLTLTDWSMDGRFLSYFSTDLAGGALYALQLDSTGERKPIEVLRSKFQLQGPRLSPDSRFVAYVTNESGRNEVYVRRFDPSSSTQSVPSEGPWQISHEGGQGMAYWRRDGKEVYFLAANRAIMAVSLTTSPNVEFSRPKVLFRPSEATPINAGMASMSRDGERVVMVVPPPQFRQLTVFDRQGKIVSTAGQPGLYVQPGLSPDGTRVVMMRNDPQTGNQDIWTMDLATGKGTPITNDTPPENAPIWSPDGKHVAYVSTRESYSGIYRKAADGSGAEELLFRYTPGAGMALTDWSPDGKFLVFNDFSGVLLVVPLGVGEKALDRKGIEWLREDYEVAQGRFSADGRFLAYLSNEADGERMEVYVRPFDANKPETSAGPTVRVSKNGALGMIFWRQDGKEMYFMTREWEVMAVELTMTPTLQAGTPRLLFKLQGPLAGNPAQWKNVSRDGERFIFAMPATPTSAAR